MKKLYISSGICTVIFSAFIIRKISQIWIVPVAFIGFCLVLALLFWIFAFVNSLHISMKKEYTTPSMYDYRILNAGYRFIYGLARARVHVSGMEDVPADQKFLLVCNHLSRFDPMVTSAALEKAPMAFLSKAGNFKIPAGRRYMKRSCYLEISQETARGAIVVINKAADLIKNDTMSVAVYPEGHRGTGLDMQQLKAGSLKIAVFAKCPILVTTISGTQDIKTRWPFKRTDVYFDILGVVYPEDKKTLELAEEIQNMMQSQLNKYKTGGPQ